MKHAVGWTCMTSELCVQFMHFMKIMQKVPMILCGTEPG